MTNPNKRSQITIWSVLFIICLTLVMCDYPVAAATGPVPPDPPIGLQGLVDQELAQNSRFGTTFKDCYHRADFERIMSGTFGETVQMALTNEHDPNGGGTMTFLANSETGTWTLMVTGATDPDVVCIVQSGIDYVPGSFSPQAPD